ncbi:Fe2+-dependent dioxygenase [Alteraurantiacibacter aquimixticola]|uniref:Fe2+-dependent dioxygenase n=1 Tax=Alteraurantiacibacter aquimixticola TaxID=2489173 RepID=A0A4T3F716_9SPHN|nr:Fe2+-dependent dioxygenase [Alteraurantiacibacter aquimixticola]TIX51492.1 Fe2+-dependent dioxygenase [Alteraurantiacibacter aquimixticola]
MLLTIEGLLSTDEVAALRDELSGAAWKDGAETAGTRSVSVKQNLQLGVTDPQAREWGNGLLSKLGRNPTFISASLAEKIFPPVFNLYQDGGHYGCHVDSALMRVPQADITIRSDISATIFLSEPDEYEGGELVVETEYGAQEVKLPAGDIVLYPSNSLHQVMPVTKGQRICAITWIQSAVADTPARSMLFDLDQSIQSLSVGRDKQDPDVDRLIHVYHNLLRRWAQV